MKQKIEKKLYLEIEKCFSRIEQHHVRCHFFKPAHFMSFKKVKLLKSDFK